MCKENREQPKANETTREEEGSPSRSGCPCEPRRCLPFAGVLLAAVAAPLVIGAIRRARHGRGDRSRGGQAAGCCP